MIKALLVFSSVLGLANAECPNACSSHGKCTAYDMCLCYRNWMSNDCSERVCQFGLAHVDTPKGDLDASSGVLDGTDDLVAINSEVYPYGTTEQFPAMTKGAGGAYLENTGHYYMECSNKGICDRESGTCECFPGYDGSACQRASCPSNGGDVCSGHGTCETIKQIAAADYSNIYELWDEKSTMGCVCDAGYYGADCALRECKYGADPLYYDDNSNIRYSNYTFVFGAALGGSTLSGTYSIVFYDHFGEDWSTDPIDADASCDDLVAALENIPNDVIPDNSVRCLEYKTGDPRLSESFYAGAFKIFKKFTIMFPENPGKLREITINKYLDGARPTLITSEAVSTLNIFVYANGFTGEDVDLVPDECEDVLVSFHSQSVPDLGANIGAYTSLGFTDEQYMVPLLKRCLGDADNDLSFGEMENEVYNWDYGTHQNPHLVKFVDATDRPESRICHSESDRSYVDGTHPAGWCFEPAPAGFYAPVIFDATLGADGEFVVYSNALTDYADGVTQFRVFTTKGHLNRVSVEAEIYTPSTNWMSYHSNVLYSINRGTAINNAVTSGYPLAFRSNSGASAWSGGIDCENNPARPNPSGNLPAEDCLQKGDYVMFFSTEPTDLNYGRNPRYHNMYTVEKIYNAYPTVDTPGVTIEEPLRNRIVLNNHVNFHFPLSTNAAGTTLTADTRLRAYKFYPASAVQYVDECSGRGLCNAAEGICECFVGYTNDDCSVQNSAAR